MALSRFNPFGFPLLFDDDFFEPPTTFFPRDLVRPRDSSDRQFWRHPGYEVHEDEKNYMVSIDVPGVRAEDMKIDVQDNMLHVSGGRKIKKDGEVSESKFDYRLAMGDVDLEKITANLDNGVLQLTAPKKEPEKPKARTITITNGPAPMQLEQDEKKEAE